MESVIFAGNSIGYVTRISNFAISYAFMIFLPIISSVYRIDVEAYSRAFDGNMHNQTIFNLAEPQNRSDATTKLYVDTLVYSNKFSGNMHNNIIYNLDNPTELLDAANKRYVDESILSYKFDGNMNNSTIFGLADPVNPFDAVNKKYTDNIVNSINYTFTGNMSNNRIFNLGNATDLFDATNKFYVDDKLDTLTNIVLANDSLLFNHINDTKTYINLKADELSYELNDTFNKLNDTVSDVHNVINAKINDVHTTVNNTILDTNNTLQDKITSVHTTVNNTISNVNTSLIDKLNTINNTVTDELDTINDTVTYINNTLTLHINTLENYVYTNNFTDVSKVYVDAADTKLSDRIVELSNSTTNSFNKQGILINTVNTTLHNIFSNISNNAFNIDNINGRLTTQNSKITTLTADVTTLKSTTSTLRFELDTLTVVVENLNSTNKTTLPTLPPPPPAPVVLPFDGNMNTSVIFNMSNPISDQDAATKFYVDTQIVANKFTGNMANNKIINLEDPTDNQDAVTKFYLTNQITANKFDGDMQNVKIVNLADCVDDKDATNKEYVDTEITANKFDGNMNDVKVINLATPTDNKDATNKEYVDTEILANKFDGDMNNAKIVNLETPTDDTDASTKKYVDDEILANKFDGNMTNNKITNMSDPEWDQDATTKKYVDEEIIDNKFYGDMKNETIYNLPWPVNSSEAVNMGYLDVNVGYKETNGLELFGVNNGYKNIETSYRDFIDPHDEQKFPNITADGHGGYWQRINSSEIGVLLDYTFKRTVFVQSVFLHPRSMYLKKRSEHQFFTLYLNGTKVYNSTTGWGRKIVNKEVDQLQLSFWHEADGTNTQFNYITINYTLSIHGTAFPNANFHTISNVGPPQSEYDAVSKAYLSATLGPVTDNGINTLFKTNNGYKNIDKAGYEFVDPHDEQKTKENWNNGIASWKKANSSETGILLDYTFHREAYIYFLEIQRVGDDTDLYNRSSMLYFRLFLNNNSVLTTTNNQVKYQVNMKADRLQLVFDENIETDNNKTQFNYISIKWTYSNISGSFPDAEGDTITNIGFPHENKDAVPKWYLYNNLNVVTDNGISTLFKINNGHKNVKKSYGSFVDPDLEQKSEGMYGGSGGHYGRISKCCDAILLDYSFAQPAYVYEVTIHRRMTGAAINRANVLFIRLYYNDIAIHNTTKNVKYNMVNKIADRVQLLFNKDSGHVQFNYITLKWTFNIAPENFPKPHNNIISGISPPIDMKDVSTKTYLLSTLGYVFSRGFELFKTNLGYENIKSSYNAFLDPHDEQNSTLIRDLGYYTKKNTSEEGVFLNYKFHQPVYVYGVEVINNNENDAYRADKLMFELYLDDSLVASTPEGRGLKVVKTTADQIKLLIAFYTNTNTHIQFNYIKIKYRILNDYINNVFDHNNQLTGNKKVITDVKNPIDDTDVVTKIYLKNHFKTVTSNSLDLMHTNFGYENIESASTLIEFVDPIKEQDGQEARVGEYKQIDTSKLGVLINLNFSETVHIGSIQLYVKSFPSTMYETYRQRGQSIFFQLMKNGEVFYNTSSGLSLHHINKYVDGLRMVFESNPYTSIQFNYFNITYNYARVLTKADYLDDNSNLKLNGKKIVGLRDATDNNDAVNLKTLYDKLTKDEKTIEWTGNNTYTIGFFPNIMILYTSDSFFAKDPQGTTFVPINAVKESYTLTAFEQNTLKFITGVYTVTNDKIKIDIVSAGQYLFGGAGYDDFGDFEVRKMNMRFIKYYQN